MATTTGGPAETRGLSFAGGAGGSVYLQPAGLLSGSLADSACAAGAALRLAGGSLAFSACAVIRRRGEQREERLLALSALRDQAAATRSRPWTAAWSGWPGPVPRSPGSVSSGR